MSALPPSPPPTFTPEAYLLWTMDHPEPMSMASYELELVDWRNQRDAFLATFRPCISASGANNALRLHLIAAARDYACAHVSTMPSLVVFFQEADAYYEQSSPDDELDFVLDTSPHPDALRWRRWARDIETSFMPRDMPFTYHDVYKAIEFIVEPVVPVPELACQVAELKAMMQMADAGYHTACQCLKDRHERAMATHSRDLVRLERRLEKAKAKAALAAAK